MESFDEIDMQSPEALGAICMLIRIRPDGWIDRVKKYIEAQVGPNKRGIRAYFLLEALYQEYYFRYLNAAELSAIEWLIAQLLKNAGFVNQRIEIILRRIEQNRPRMELLTRELRR